MTDSPSLETASLILTIGILLSCCTSCACCLTFLCSDEPPSVKRFRKELMLERAKRNAAKKYEVAEEERGRDAGGTGGEGETMGGGEGEMSPTALKTVDEDDEPGSYSRAAAEQQQQHVSSSQQGVVVPGSGSGSAAGGLVGRANAASAGSCTSTEGQHGKCKQNAAALTAEDVNLQDLGLGGNKRLQRLLAV